MKVTLATEYSLSDSQEKLSVVSAESFANPWRMSEYRPRFCSNLLCDLLCDCLHCCHCVKENLGTIFACLYDWFFDAAEKDK